MPTPTVEPAPTSPGPRPPRAVPPPTAWWRRLTDPPPSVPEAQQYPARMLASLQLVVLAMSLATSLLILAGAFPFQGDLRQLTVRLTVLVTLGLVVAFAAGRSGRFHLSAYLTVGLSLAGALLGVRENPTSVLAPAFVVVAGLLGGLFLPTFATILVFAATILLVSLLAPAVGSLTRDTYLMLVFFVGMVGAIMAMASWQRELRSAQIRAQGEALADRQARLEQALRSGESSSQELIRSLQELHQIQRDTGLLSEWSEMMHACAATGDVYPVVGHFAQLVFPQARGGLYLYDLSNNDLEHRVGWGPTPSADRFSPEACWALRRGQVHSFGGNQADGLRCDHLPDRPDAASVCAPLMAQSEIVGLLCLTFPPGTDGGIIQAAADLAGDASRRVAVALANLQLREVLRNQSLRDPLTNLFNRRMMEEMLLREIRRSERSQSSFSVLMLDLDHFKKFNDDHGHPAGDLLLQQVAERIVGRIRGSDVACRYGGEELVVILVEAGLDDAVRRADAVRQEIGALRIDYHGVLLRPVTVSIGVASYPEHGQTPDLLIHAADTALYQAKNAGRDCVRHAPAPKGVG